MRISYPLTVEDNLAFVRHQYETLPAIRRSRKRSLIVASLMYPFFAALAYVEKSWVVLTVGAIIATGYVMFVGYYHRHGYLKRVERLLRAKSGGNSVEQVELTLSGSELTVKTDTSEATTTMERFSRLDSSDDYTFLYINEQKAIIIPRFTVREGDYSEFTRRLRQLYDEAHAAG